MRFQIFVAAILAFAIPFLTSQSSAQERDASIQFESAKAAFDALASDFFLVRQAAEQYLKEASGEAIPVVIDGWLDNKGDSLEQKTRCRTIIDGWLDSHRPTIKVQLWCAIMLHPNRADSVGGKWYGHPHFTRDVLDRAIRQHFQGTGINPSWDFCEINKDWLESDEDMAIVAAMPELKWLSKITSIGISGTGIDSDRVAAQFAEATHLEKVNLSWSAVTDHGVHSLAKMTFLKQLNLMTNTASKTALDQLKADLSANTKLTCDSSGNPAPEQSELLGELYEKGAWIYSAFGESKHLYIREKLWKGSETDVERALNGLDWTRLVIDLPLTPKLVQVLKQSVDRQVRYISVRDNGQHPQPMLERLRESGKFRPSEDRHGARLTFDPRTRAPGNQRLPK